MTLRAMIPVSLVGFLVGLGLSSPSEELVDPPRRTAAGQDIASLVTAIDTSVVAIVDPADVLACDNVMPMLQMWEQAHPGHAALVLTRPPTVDERIQMRRLRLDPAAILHGEEDGAGQAVVYRSTLLVFVDGREVMSEFYSEAQTRSGKVLPLITMGASTRWAWSE